ATARYRRPVAVGSKPKCLASARAIVPLPLAAGPSTAMRRLSFRARSLAILLRRFDSAISLWQGAPPNAGRCPRRTSFVTGVEAFLVKPEWGAKRTCPKRSTRFYDLGNEDPVHCISCGTEWI